MSTLYFHNSHFNLNSPLVSNCLFFFFQAKTDTITQWIRPSHDDPFPIHEQYPLLLHQKTGLAFPGIEKSPMDNLPTNNPLGGLLVDDMGLSKTIQAIALIGTSKEQLITNPQCSTPTIIIYPPCLITNWQSEIDQHAQAGALQANTYHGPTCHSLSEADILKCNIVITSYNTITK
ncbi:hypothetical protein O181_026211 [Austropuccinia psidii MF-1]|uniref:SNF2 N-terminal domain-containing protein n=1 Tax=Austropuccinia psidii MF-1 TaxID=1389203 RepID=A0A9Q3CK15_9BASI|nr:hypothetical protein [Austropuccinia psidii MF-1]